MTITGLSSASSHNAVIAFRCAGQRAVVNFDIMLIAKCHFGKKHDPNTFVLRPRHANCTHTVKICIEYKKAVLSEGNRAMPHATYSTPIPPKILGLSPWSRSVLLCYTVAKTSRLIPGDSNPPSNCPHLRFTFFC